MPRMRRFPLALLAIVALALVLPAAAPATLSEVGVIAATTPVTAPSCPASPCLAVSRTTGFQARVAASRNPLSVPRDGTIVAWTISLGKPTAKLIASSPLVKLEPYFGKTAQFPLETTIPVKKGDVIGLSVPSWAPALALGFGNDTSWRASRPRKGCASTSAQTTH